MSQALIPSPAGPQGPSPHHAAEGAKPAENPLLLVHKLLRGRYWLAILLAVILGPLGGAAGYLSMNLEYTSSSTIRIAPVLPKILYDNDQNSMLPMFDSYLQTQASLLSSQRVVQKAIDSEIWRNAGGAAFSPKAQAEFTENLKITQPRSSQLLVVSYTAPSPALATAATKSVVESYMRVYVDTDQSEETKRFRTLEDRATSLRNEIAALKEQIRTEAHNYGSDDLSTDYTRAMDSVYVLQSELEAARLQLISMEAITGDSGNEDRLDYTKLTDEEIALIDPRMRQLVDKKKSIQLEISAFESSLRRPESRPEYRRAIDTLKSVETDIADYAQAFRENPLMAPVTDGSGQLAPTATAVAQLRTKVAQLESRVKETRANALEIGQKNLLIGGLRDKLSGLTERLEETEFRIEELSLESSSVSGRVSVISDAELPSSPSNAKKRLQFLILGGLAGGGLGIGLVLGLGFLNAKIRDITDAQDIKPRLLGALPLLPDQLSSPAEVTAAAQCVHQIRTILHANMPPHEPLCLNITASNSGAGKTSFALSLGLSFASAGTRTLIIDGDVLGTGLTRRTGASGRIRLGHVLRRHEVITEEESRHALQVAQQSGTRLGHALLELGYISEDDLEDGLSMQKDGGLGLADVLDGEHVENCLADIGIPNLTILPASRRRRIHTHAMSPVALRRLIDELRGTFDIILIDSGPIPGTTDATVMATCADGVILVASRGEQGGDVQRTLHHLRDLNVPVVGLVFNRAEPSDIARSKYSSSAVSSSKRDKSSNGRAQEPVAIDLTEILAPVSNIGPVAQSVWISTMNPAVLSETEAVF